MIQSIGRFIRRALEREGNILRGVRRGRGEETGSLEEELRLHNNPLRTPPMDVCISGVILPIGRFIRRALEREGNILRGVRRGRGEETGSLEEELPLHNNPLRTPPMDVCVSGVIQSIGRLIRRALEREGNILRGVRRGRGEGNRESGGGTTFTQQSSEHPTNGCLR